MQYSSVQKICIVENYIRKKCCENVVRNLVYRFSLFQSLRNKIYLRADGHFQHILSLAVSYIIRGDEKPLSLPCVSVRFSVALRRSEALRFCPENETQL
jgi:hypothetical protein